MIKTQYINLNMTPSGVMPVLYVSQYDIGRPLGMVVYNGGEAVDLDSYTCTIEATRTDGTPITAAVTTNDNIGAFVTTATMTNKADKYLAKLVLFDSNSRRVASLAFVMCVTLATMDENAESIEEDKSLYQQFTGTVQTLIAEIREDLADLKNHVKKHLYDGNTIAPVYIGDYIAYPTMLPSAVVRVGDIFYTIDANSNAISDMSNIGLLHRFDLGRNAELFDTAILGGRTLLNVGHANSMAYDGQNMWIVPIFDYENYSAAGVTYIYRYSGVEFDPESCEKIAVPTVVQSVTYDWIGRSLYCMNQSTGAVYKRSTSDTDWVLYTTIDMSSIVESEIETRSLQDFAVYDGMFYISSPYCNLYHGKLTPGHAEVINSYRVLNADIRMMYKMGELEGMEFTPSGHLYAMMYIRINGLLKNAYVVELAVGTAIPSSANIGSPYFDAHQTILALSDNTVNKFALATDEIRSTQQLASRWTTQDAIRIEIPSGSDVVEEDWTIADLVSGGSSIPRDLTFRDNIEIRVTGRLTANKINTVGGELSFLAPTDSTDGLITLLADNSDEYVSMFTIGRTGSLKFVGDAAVNLSFPHINNTKQWHCILSAHYNSFICGILPICQEGYEITINGRKVEARCLYVGAQAVNRLEAGRQYLIGLSGYASSSTNLTFRYYPPAQIPMGMTASLSGSVFIIGSKGFINGISSMFRIALDGSTPGYTVTTIISSTRKYVEINISANTEFTNVDVHTPVMMYPDNVAGAIDFAY